VRFFLAGLPLAVVGWDLLHPSAASAARLARPTWRGLPHLCLTGHQVLEHERECDRSRQVLAASDFLFASFFSFSSKTFIIIVIKIKRCC
jgi:hypothetical protein